MVAPEPQDPNYRVRVADSFNRQQAMHTLGLTIVRMPPGEIVLTMARETQRLTQKKNLVLAGGVALNCVANGRLLREGPFIDLWIQPAAGDAGGALGAALFVWYQLLENPRPPAGRDMQRGSLLGPEFSNDQVAAVLAACKPSLARIAVAIE